ncbi:DNA replication protein [Salmonella enterica subsp. enterica]|nr:DNA replication protein [Salmonella enterica subsp. enterica]
MMPAHITPAFKTGEELLAWQKEQGEIRAAALARENRAMKMQRTFNRSGIRPLHQNCSFDNYRVECDGQMNALSKARQYVDEFDGNIASFVFSGKPGTGKNHLAAAICNELLLARKVSTDYHRSGYYVSDERHVQQSGNQRRAVA